MKAAKFQLRGKNSVCVGAFQLLRGRAPAQLRGNNATTTVGLVRTYRVEHNTDELSGMAEGTKLMVRQGTYV
jgi:hypothetical protein